MVHTKYSVFSAIIIIITIIIIIIRLWAPWIGAFGLILHVMVPGTY